MCGISGFVSYSGVTVDPLLIRKMTSLIDHRGPDDAGEYVDEEAGVWLGHRRLSIIDLSPLGHQPMANEDGTVWIVFNGEVYNYRELIPELRAKGHVFRSGSDTEVIIHAYEEWGTDCLSHFNGMWSFAIYDQRKRQLFCARDRLGVKPFYYRVSSQGLAFGSEIKQFFALPDFEFQPDPAIAHDFLAYGFLDHSDRTHFDGVRQLRGGEYFVMPIDGGPYLPRIMRFWDVPMGQQRRFETDRDAQAAFFELFEDAVRLRLRSDVPVGSCLSGGLDSSSIVCMVHHLLKAESDRPKQVTISSCSEISKYDERQFIEIVEAKTGVEAHHVFPSDQALFDVLPRLIWHQDEPFGSTSIYAQWCVFEKARQAGLTVMLDGQGADEILAGYHMYYGSYFAQLIRSGDLAGLFREVGGFRARHEYPAMRTLRMLGAAALPNSWKNTFRERLNGSSDVLNREYLLGAGNLTPGQELYRTEDPTENALEHHLYRQLKHHLPSLLHYEDRNSMAHSIESRVPFLDYRLVEFMFSLPSNQKIRGGETKHILRKALASVLPEAIANRQDKVGFVTPMEVWMKDSIRGQFMEVMTSKEAKELPYFRPMAFQKEFERYLNGARDFSFTPWRWINMVLWHDQMKKAKSRLTERHLVVPQATVSTNSATTQVQAD